MERLRILSLDLGNRTGWAISDYGDVTDSGIWDMTPTRFSGGGMRFLKFRINLKQIYVQSGGIDAVFFEEVVRHGRPGKGSNTIAAQVYGGYLAILTSFCEDYSIPYDGVPVGTIKKFITKTGKASKEDVIAAVQSRGHDPLDDNEADAIAIAYYAQEVIGG